MAEMDDRDQEIIELRERVEALTSALIRLARATKEISDVVRELPGQPGNAGFNYMEIDSIITEYRHN